MNHSQKKPYLIMVNKEQDNESTIRALQERLNERGANLKVDGWGGNETRKALDRIIPQLTENPQPEKSVSQNGLDLIKHFEGLYLTAYRDPVGIWTIGYGHTGIKHNDGTVKSGRKITPQEANDLLAFDLNTKYLPEVLKLVKVNINQNQLDALVSFNFNTGALGSSTLLKKLNQSDYSGAAEEFLKWVNAGGKKFAGLVRRRNAERELFISGDWKRFKS